MAMLTSRDDLKQYCLRTLGNPLVQINATDAQLEDRIDDALEYWRLYYYDGIEQVYMKQKITATIITLIEDVAETFQVGEVVTGQTSGAVAKVTRELDRNSSGKTLIVYKVIGDFIPGETITGQVSDVTATITNVVIGNYDKGYIEIPDIVFGIHRIIPLNEANSTGDIFNLQYQLRLHDLFDLSSASVIYYSQVMQHLALLDFELNAKPNFRFNRVTNRLYLDIDWDGDVRLGEYIIIDALRALDPAEFTRVWNDKWLKDYTTAQFKKTWATNLKKFSGMQLPGGVTIDGDKLYDEAITEIKDLESDLRDQSSPLGFYVG